MMIASALVGAVASAACAAGLRAWAWRRQVVQKVGVPFVQQERALPPVGGVALAIGCIAGVVAWSLQSGMRWSDQWIGLAGAGTVILVIGLIDDFVRELAPWQKLVGQSLAWLFLVRGGLVTQIALLPVWANLLVSLIWTLAVINAFNLLDIADGLAIGIGLVAAGTFLALSLFAHQPMIAGLLAVVCGALAGVLIFNFPRATLFLGDSGSLLLGLLLAALALAISYAPLGREVALVTPIAVLGLPLYDLAFVTLVRLRNGRAVFKKSPDHFVFRLVRRGRSPARAVLAMLGLCAAFGVTALVISRSSNLLGLMTIAMVGGVSLWWGLRVARIPMA